MPSSYPFDQNTDPDFQKQSGYHIRKGPSLEDSAHSEITYLRKITATVTMTKSMYLTDERNDSKIYVINYDIWYHQQNLCNISYVAVSNLLTTGIFMSHFKV